MLFRSKPYHHLTALSVAAMLVLCTTVLSVAEDTPADASADKPKEPGQVAPADVAAPEEFKPYTQEISGTDVTFDMVPIQGGEFLMGSPEGEEGHVDNEGPQRKVKIAPFWMGKHEVTWDEYDIWSFNLDIQRRNLTKAEPTDLDKIADAVTRPTKPYTDMTFGMGHDGYPAICMTQLAAKMYCRWLSEKTGHYYRLPTEAEWEYACRAGTTTAYSFGDDPALLEEYGWNEDNSDFQYQPIGEKEPNPWGLHDMHGGVGEWTLDAFNADFYKSTAGKTLINPVNVPNVEEEYNRVVRGGSWDQSADELRSAARLVSTPDWKQQDPQRPQSIWYLTDALHVGFRVVRPVHVPDEETRIKLTLEPVPGEVTEEGLKEGFVHDEDE